MTQAASAAHGAPGVPANNMNLLRLFFATAVVFSHCFEVVDRGRQREPANLLFHTVALGDLAVDGFFLLSGFLILHSWQRDPRLFAFLQRRLLRIHPGFIVATLIGGFLVAPYFAADAAAYWQALDIPHFLLRMLLLCEPDVPPTFAGLPYPDLNGAMWTIQYEFLCYLLVGLLGLFGLARSRALWLFLLVASIVACFFPEQLLALKGGPKSRWLVMDEPGSFVRFLSFFAAGASYYLWRDRLRLDARTAALAALACIVAMFRFDTGWIVLPTAGAYLLFWLSFAKLPDNPLSRFCDRQDLSYGVYLYGWPAQQSLLFFLRPISPYLLFLPAAAVAGACGWLSWVVVERRCLRLKPR